MQNVANPTRAASKVPAVTLAFWVIKVIATTLGETGGDAVTMELGLGYLVGTDIFITLFVVAVAAQIAVTRFRPLLYWAVIVATTTAGTTLADLFDRSLGVGYVGGSTILFALLGATLYAWHRTLGTVSVSDIVTPRAETFYWATIMFSQTLGTALGDFVADTGGLGYQLGALVFGAALLVVGGLYRFTAVSRTALFWIAFILTRPLGATVGDLLDKPIGAGGFSVDRITISVLLAVTMLALIAIFPQRAGHEPGNTPRA